LKISCGITSGFSWTIFKKYESKEAGNIGAAVRDTIPEIGIGNPGSNLSGFVEKGAWIILP
jgi:hypothetical protein